MSNISVTVRYFALFRDMAGTAEATLTVPAQTTGELFDTLASQWAFSEPRTHCKVAVNDELVDWQHSLVSGDTVLLFPPVAGG
ncbi:MAG: MoaD/ThiS family protein [Pseudomonadota bacterium]